MNIIQQNEGKINGILDKIVSDLRNRYQGYRIKFKINNNQIIFIR